MQQWKSIGLKLGGVALSIGLALACLSTPVNAGSNNESTGEFAAGKFKLRMPTRITRARTSRKTDCAWRSNTLLVMPCDPKNEEAQESMQDLQGTVTRTIGSGSMTVWVVTFPDTEHFVKAEKSLASDKKFRSVQRNYVMHSDATTNDPYFAQQWHLNALNVPAAWDRTFGSSSASIVVIDTGVDMSNTDLQGKLFSGYDAVNNTNYQSDVNGHGTMVSTTAAALANNLIATVGPARLSTVYPCRASNAQGLFYSDDILDGFNYAINNTPAKLINFSVNGDPPYSIANQYIHSTLHSYFRTFHDVKGGLIFNAAGNGDDNGDGIRDTNPLLPYLIVVSAIDQSGSLTQWSNYGNCIWFAAPGDNIFCTKATNTVVSVAGTSFSSPLTCSIAALIWGAKPSLTNLQVESIMKNHSTNYTTGWNQFFGYGIPDAAACVTAAINTVTPQPLVPPPPKTKKRNPNKLWRKRN
jgi:subtilisin family serine protease